MANEVCEDSPWSGGKGGRVGKHTLDYRGSVDSNSSHGPMLPGTWNLDSHPIIEGGREGVSFGIIRT